MSYIILDLEWNGSYSKLLHKYVNEIIEFGAVKTDDDFNIIDRFSTLVRPDIGKRLCGKVRELTKLTNEELKSEGTPFLRTFKEFSSFVGDGVVMTWSTSDILALIENYSYYTGQNKLPFLSRYCDVQPYCEDCLNLHDASAQLGLSACAEKIGIKFCEDEHHRAFADAEITLMCVKHFIKDFPMEPYIENCENNEFYDKITFKNHYITDINSPDIDRKQLRFVCEKCGKQARRTSKWKVRNRAFTASFVCKGCGERFSGKVSFKKKYDGVTVRKKTVKPKNENAEETTEASSQE